MLGAEPRAAPPGSPAPAHAATIAAVAGALVVAQMVAGKATRDALFLTSHRARDLAPMMLGSAVISLVAVLVTTRALSRLGPGRAVPFTFGLSAVFFVAEWVMLPRLPALTATLLYLHIASLGGVTVSGYWSVVTDRFDPRSARRLIGRINAGAALGGLVGGLLAAQLASAVGLRSMVLLLALGNGVAALFVDAITQPSANVPPPDVARVEAARLLRDTPYLQLLAGLVAATGAVAALADYAFKASVAAEIQDGTQMARVFALFYGLSSLSTFVVQALLARRSLQRLGPAGTIAILPVGVVAFGLVAMVATRLATVIALRGVEVSLSHSVFRSAYELFYTPLRPENRRAVKTIIDVAFDRLGDTLGAALVLGLLLWLPDRATSMAIALAVGLSAAAVWICRRLYAGYVNALADAVKASAIALEPGEALDATTRLSMSQIAVGASATQLGFDAAGHGVEPVLARARELASGDAGRILRALTEPLDARLTPFVLPLLARQDLQHAAGAALRAVAPRVAGQIADALLDPATADAVRLRLPPLLASAGDQRAAAALALGLADRRFAVRARCARALARLVESDAGLPLAHARLAAAAGWELDAIGSNLERGDRDRVLSHVFAILSLAFRAPALRLAWLVLRSTDERARGTALEYLDNVVPPDLRVRLTPHLEQRRPRGTAVRTNERLLDALRRSAATSAIREPREPRASAAP